MSEATTRPIICGTDFSEPSQQAADVAVALARRLGAPLVLVHGVDERGDIPSGYWARFMAEDRPELEKETARLRQLGMEVRAEIVGGVPDEGVAKYAEKARARLIVLGSGGKGTVERWILGSAAERIAESATMPVLIVRDPIPLETWARNERALKIFVGADFTPASDAALRWVAELPQAGPCEITVGFVDRPPGERAELAVFDGLNLTVETPEARARNENDLRAKAEQWLGVKPAMLRVIPGSARVDTHLLELAEEASADLIVIGTHQWRGVSRLRHASVSRRVLREARTNVACVPSHGLAAEAHAALPQVRRVLAATDLSPHASRAIPHAYSVLGAGGTVCLVHVAKPGGNETTIRAQLRELIPAEAAQRDLQTELRVIEHPDAAAGICEAADRFNADVICIGSHGRSGVLAAAFGSVAHRVIGQSSRPVLVVRPPPV